MRSIVIVGDRQLEILGQLYLRLNRDRSQRRLTYIPSHVRLSTESMRAISEADVIVEQVQDVEPKADLSQIGSKADKILVPQISAGFLWPFAGQAHPRNQSLPYLEDGPYPAELGDAYLNRMIERGAAPEATVATYLDLDVNSVINLDHRFQITMRKQRSRDQAANFRMADLIEEHFRDEPIFRTPNRPNPRIALALASQLFERLGLPRTEIDQLNRSIRTTPFPKDELPLHPSVCRHFGLRYVADGQRYRIRNEGLFTFAEYALLYMQFTWNQRLAEGLALARHGDLELALDCLSTAVALSPESAAGHCALSYVLRHLGRLDEAISAARRAAALEPDNTYFRAQLVTLLQQTGALEEAEREIRAAISFEPLDPGLGLLHVRMLRDLGRIEDGLAVARNALAGDPDFAHLHVELGQLLERSGDVSWAEGALRRAVDLSGGQARASKELADFLERRDRLKEALDAVQVAINASSHGHQTIPDLPAAAEWGDPSEPWTALDADEAEVDLRGTLLGLLERCDPSEALEVARAAINRFPTEFWLRIAISQLLHQLGDLDSAIAEARAAIEIAPEDFQSHANLGSLLMRAGDHAGAEQALRHCIKIAPDNAHAYGELGFVLSQSERHADAIAMRCKAAELEPDNPYRLAQLGHTYLEACDFLSAEEALFQAIALAPEIAEFHHDLSTVFALAGRFDEAAFAASRAAAMDPKNATWRAALGEALTAAGDFVEAEQAFRAAIELDRKNSFLYFRLSQVLTDLRRTEEARAIAQEAITLDPDNADLREYFETLAPSKVEADLATLA